MYLKLIKPFSQFTLFFIYFSFSIIQAQVDTLWTKTFGGSSFDEGYSVQQTADEGYIIVGTTRSFGAGSRDIFFIKTDTKGDTLWTKTFGGDGDDGGCLVQHNADGGYVITGWTSSFGAGSNDIWLIKTNASGDTLWTKTFGGDGSDIGYSVQQTKDEGYIITGLTYSFGTGDADIWMIKTNSAGDTLWTKTFGGNDYDGGYSIKQTKDEGYIIAGYKEVGYENTDVWLIKTGVSGDTLWTKTFGGSGYDKGFSVQQTIDEGYIIAGATYSFGAGGYDIWLVKTNASGDTLWTKTFGESGYEQGYAVQQTTDEGYIITGYARARDIWLIKTDASGDTLWTKTFGGSWEELGRSVQQTTDGGYIITGYKDVSVANNWDVWLIKTTSEANKVIQNDDKLISGYDLVQNYPNPFNPSTTIEFTLPKSEWVTLKIFNVLGQQVSILVSDQLNPGLYKFEWQVDNMPSGIYFCRLMAGKIEQVRKMILFR